MLMFLGFLLDVSPPTRNTMYALRRTLQRVPALAGRAAQAAAGYSTHASAAPSSARTVSWTAGSALLAATAAGLVALGGNTQPAHNDGVQVCVELRYEPRFRVRHVELGWTQ